MHATLLYLTPMSNWLLHNWPHISYS